MIAMFFCARLFTYVYVYTSDKNTQDTFYQEIKSVMDKNKPYQEYRQTEIKQERKLRTGENTIVKILGLKYSIIILQDNQSPC